MKDESIEKIEVSIISQQEAYHWLASSLHPGEEEKMSVLMEASLMREQNGNIQIEEGITLLHIEHELITESKTIILYPQKTIIQWNEAIEQIDLILFVLLSPNETTEKKKKIANFMRRLVDERSIQTLKKRK